MEHCMYMTLLLLLGVVDNCLEICMNLVLPLIKNVVHAVRTSYDHPSIRRTRIV